jgi:REP element-mobilizing transposase RayT
MPVERKENNKKKKRPKKGEQLVLARTGGVGGKRKGAGRKPTPGKRRRVPHRRRAKLDGTHHPVHVTMRVRRAVGVPSLRREVVKNLLRAVLRETSSSTFHVPHHSMQDDHLHLMVEAMDAKALASGMSSLLIRFAKRLNALLRRTGSVWDGRYHRHDLVTPTEVAHCLVYVLQNGKKHGHAPRDARWLDEYSSATEFNGWVDVTIDVARIERPPRTWLLRIGWRKARVAIASSSAPRAMAA